MIRIICVFFLSMVFIAKLNKNRCIVRGKKKFGSMIMNAKF